MVSLNNMHFIFQDFNACNDFVELFKLFSGLIHQIIMIKNGIRDPFQLAFID